MASLLSSVQVDSINWFAFKINENGKFGFVEDVFIEPNIISKMNLQNQQKISGIALLSFNKKKEGWGWKAINLNNQNLNK